MKKKIFKEPEIPSDLTSVQDAVSFLAAAREQDMEILRRRFENVFLTKLEGSFLSFKQVIFQNCKFISCNFNETRFTDVILKNCDFSNSSFNDTGFQNCTFLNCKAVGADFYGSSIRHTSFEQCNFRNAGFDASVLSYIRGNHTDFTEAGFSMCKISNVEWNDVCFKQASFFKTLLDKLDFTQCDITAIVVSDDKKELKGAVVNMAQAVELAKRLGIVIK